MNYGGSSCRAHVYKICYFPKISGRRYQNTIRKSKLLIWASDLSRLVHNEGTGDQSGPGSLHKARGGFEHRLADGQGSLVVLGPRNPVWGPGYKRWFEVNWSKNVSWDENSSFKRCQNSELRPSVDYFGASMENNSFCEKQIAIYARLWTNDQMGNKLII